MKLSLYLHYTKSNIKWNKIQRALTIKEITDKFYYIKVKNFYSRHNVLKRENRVEDTCNP